MLLDARQNFNDPLGAERLARWHAGLLPDGRSGLRTIRTGAWRDDTEGPQVISGRIGNERVHYEAPPAARVQSEMEAFFAWFNAPIEGDGLERDAYYVILEEQQSSTLDVTAWLLW
ncbi:MAG: hypothetical protein H7Z43_03190 [Clostridia bacterium]|nr:hypothetical protein [Deltaproteobacteria bacterium]